MDMPRAIQSSGSEVQIPKKIAPKKYQRSGASTPQTLGDSFGEIRYEERQSQIGSLEVTSLGETSHGNPDNPNQLEFPYRRTIPKAPKRHLYLMPGLGDFYHQGGNTSIIPLKGGDPLSKKRGAHPINDFSTLPLINLPGQKSTGPSDAKHRDSNPTVQVSSPVADKSPHAGGEGRGPRGNGRRHTDFNYLISEPVELQIESLSPTVARLITFLWYAVLIISIIVLSIISVEWGASNACGSNYKSSLSIASMTSPCATIYHNNSNSNNNKKKNGDSSSSNSSLSSVSWPLNDLKSVAGDLKRFRRIAVSLLQLSNSSQTGDGLRVYNLRGRVAGTAFGQLLESEYDLKVRCPKKAGLIHCLIFRIPEDIIGDSISSNANLTLMDLPDELIAGINSSAVAIVYQKEAYSLGTLIWRYVLLFLSLFHLMHFVAYKKFTGTLYEQTWVFVLQLALFWYLNPLSALSVLTHPPSLVLSFLEYRIPNFFMAIMISFMFSVMTASMPWKTRSSQNAAKKADSTVSMKERIIDFLCRSKGIYDPPLWTKICATVYVLAVIILDVIDATLNRWEWYSESDSDSHFPPLFWVKISLLLFGSVVCFLLLFYLRRQLGRKPYLDSRPQQLACRIFIHVFLTTIIFYFIQVMVFLMYYNIQVRSTMTQQPFIQLPAIMVATFFVNIMTFVYTNQRRDSCVPIHPRDQRWKYTVWPDTWYQWLARHGGSQYIFFTEGEEINFYHLQLEFRRRQLMARLKNKDRRTFTEDSSPLGSPRERHVAELEMSEIAANQSLPLGKASHLNLNIQGFGIPPPIISDRKEDPLANSFAHINQSNTMPAFHPQKGDPRDPFSRTAAAFDRHTEGSLQFERKSPDFRHISQPLPENSETRYPANTNIHQTYANIEGLRSANYGPDLLKMDCFSSYIFPERSFMSPEGARIIAEKSMSPRQRTLHAVPLARRLDLRLDQHDENDPLFKVDFPLGTKMNGEEGSYVFRSATSNIFDPSGFKPHPHDVFGAQAPRRTHSALVYSFTTDQTRRLGFNPNSDGRFLSVTPLPPNDGAPSGYTAQQKKAAFYFPPRNENTDASNLQNLEQDNSPKPDHNIFSQNEKGLPHTRFTKMEDGKLRKTDTMKHRSFAKTLTKAHRKMGDFFKTAEEKIIHGPLAAFDKVEQLLASVTYRPFEKVKYLPFFNLETAIDCFNMSWEAYSQEDGLMMTAEEFVARTDSSLAKYNLKEFFSCCHPKVESEAEDNDEDDDDTDGDDNNRNQRDSENVANNEHNVAGGQDQNIKGLPFRKSTNLQSDNHFKYSASESIPGTTQVVVSASTNANGSVFPENVEATSTPLPLMAKTPHPKDSTQTPTKARKEEGEATSVKNKEHYAKVEPIPKAPVGKDIIPTLCVEKYGYEKILVFEAKGVQVIIARMNMNAIEHRGKFPRIVIAFRGTANMSNAKHDANIHRVVWREMERSSGAYNDDDNNQSLRSEATSNQSHGFIGFKAFFHSFAQKTRSRPTVHAGFLTIWKDLRKRVARTLTDTLKKDSETTYRVFVTGHSLGGALASLCAYSVHNTLARMRYPIPDVTVYTFGQPRMGNRTFKERYEKAVPRTFRIVNESDVVAKMSILGGYHVGIQVDIDRNGNYIVKPSYIEKSLKPTKGQGLSVIHHLLVNYATSINIIAEKTQCAARCMSEYQVRGDQEEVSFDQNKEL